MGSPVTSSPVIIALLADDDISSVPLGDVLEGGPLVAGNDDELRWIAANPLVLDHRQQRPSLTCRVRALAEERDELIRSHGLALRALNALVCRPEVRLVVGQSQGARGHA